MSKPYIEIKNIAELCSALGFSKSQAARIEIRRDLVVAIHNKIKSRKLTHESAAKIAGVGRTVSSCLAQRAGIVKAISAGFRRIDSLILPMVLA